MSALRRWLRRLAASASSRADDARMTEELETHLRMQTADHVRAGLSPEEARRRALLEFGPIEAIKDSYRDERRLPLLDSLAQDGRDALRQLRKSPLFTFTAVVSLALGIGANAGVFSVVERLFLRPLPVSRPHELVYVTDERILTRSNVRFSYPLYQVLRDGDVLNGIAARFALGMNVTVNGTSARASGELVSGNYFAVLGVGAETGRLLSAEDDRSPGAHPVAVISQRFWRRALGSDPAAIGRTVLINERAFTIVGVAARGFTGTAIGSPADVWIPLAMQREVGRDHLTDARTNWLEMLGRLRDGQTMERAADALTRDLLQRGADLRPDTIAVKLVLLPAAKGTSPARAELGSALLVLFALTALALALACANVACLAAVRTAGRERELAVRLSLGAGRARLAQQLLTEGLVLAALGGSVGVLMAPWAARMLIAAQGSSIVLEPGVDARGLVFALVLCLLTGVFVAVVPILVSRRVPVAPATARLRPAGARPPRRPAVPDAIVTLQIALALSMLISAALLAQSLRSFASVDPGFRAGGLLLATIDPGAAGLDSTRVDTFWRAALEQLRRLPGVESVTLAGTVPLTSGRQRQPWLNPASGEKVELDTNFVGPDYFGTLDIPLIAGRDFDDNDRRGSRPVVIVNERTARAFWPEHDPLGNGVRLPDSGNPTAEVVGVVRDVKYQDLRGEALPMIYRPVLQTRSTDDRTLHVRSAVDPDALAGLVRLAIRSIDPNVAVFDVTTLEAQLDASFAETRHAALLTGTFGVLALLLSGVGVYGVTALAVSRRTRDLGIRMALGARRADVARAVAGRSLGLIAVGLVLGLAGALAFTRVTGTLVFGVTTGDAGTFGSMAALLASVSLLGVAIPVRAATRLDALAAIRHE